MHRASGLNEEDGAFKKAHIAPDDFKRLIILTKELLNNITHKRDRDTHAFNLSATQDTVRLLEDLNGLRLEKLGSVPNSPTS